MTSRAFTSALLNSRFVWSVVTQSQAHTQDGENNHFVGKASNYLENPQLE